MKHPGQLPELNRKELPLLIYENLFNRVSDRGRETTTEFHGFCVNSIISLLTLPLEVSPRNAQRRSLRLRERCLVPDS